MDKRFEMFFLSLRTFDLSSHIEEIWFKLDFTVNIATLSKKKKSILIDVKNQMAERVKTRVYAVHNFPNFSMNY